MNNNISVNTSVLTKPFFQSIKFSPLELWAIEETIEQVKVYKAPQNGWTLNSLTMQIECIIIYLPDPYETGITFVFKMAGYELLANEDRFIFL
ncbi:hypothetical protein [Zooshikella sp. RANM57]|uniref:hypothetical protein n=1 Tax=Zooshikella sp. RANM57 TaxID=3425863 RepID=UPI003D6EDCAC